MSIQPRAIDAATLEIEISILCNPELFQAHFRRALEAAFPEGEHEARTFLTRLIAPRNQLYHARPISVREAERIICYSHDVIDALKLYYREVAMIQEYDAPSIIRLADSFGGSFHADQLKRNNTGAAVIDRRQDASCDLRPGDSLSVETEIDPSFDANSYEIKWNYPGCEEEPVGPKIIIEITEKQIMMQFSIVCTVTSDKTWHRRGHNDDQLRITYKVLPPID